MSTPKVHHVVYCVRPENVEPAAAFWRDLGLSFEDVNLEGLGIRVLLDWTAGIELVSPADPAGTETARFQAFLDNEGEGVYSIVVRTDEVDGPIAAATRHGATIRYQQHRDSGTDEVDFAPIFGMAVTFLATAKPD